LFYILGERNLIAAYPVDNFEYRYSNRMRIFEQCYFIKPVAFAEFKSKMEDTYKSPD
jgi:hypothetical protein